MREGSCFILQHCSYLILLETSVEEAFFSPPVFVFGIFVSNYETVAIALFLGCIFCTDLYDCFCLNAMLVLVLGLYSALYNQV